LFEYKAKLIRVIDGDTMVMSVDLGFYIQQEMRLRLARVDTPELRGEHKERGMKAKKFVQEQLENQIIAIRTYKVEKWGRFLADVYYNDSGSLRDLFDKGKNLSDRLVEENLAVYVDLNE
jgi:micrococcal nuclease